MCNFVKQKKKILFSTTSSRTVSPTAVMGGTKPILSQSHANKVDFADATVAPTLPLIKVQVFENSLVSFAIKQSNAVLNLVATRVDTDSMSYGTCTHKGEDRLRGLVIQTDRKSVV